MTEESDVHQTDHAAPEGPAGRAEKIPLGDLIQIAVAIALALVSATSQWTAVKVIGAAAIAILAVVVWQRARRRPELARWRPMSIIIGLLALVVVTLQVTPAISATSESPRPQGSWFAPTSRAMSTPTVPATQQPPTVAPVTSLRIDKVTFGKGADGAWTAEVRGRSDTLPENKAIYVVARPANVDRSASESPPLDADKVPGLAGMSKNDIARKCQLVPTEPSIGSDDAMREVCKEVRRRQKAQRWYAAPAHESADGAWVASLSLPEDALDQGDLTFFAVYFETCPPEYDCGPDYKGILTESGPKAADGLSKPFRVVPPR